jgi:predicted aspartyl protease
MHISLTWIFGLICGLALNSCSSLESSQKTGKQKVHGFELTLKPDKDDHDAANWFVDAEIENRRYQFYLDTGAASTSMVFDKYTSQFTSKGINNSSGAIAKHSNDLIVIPQIRVGSISKSNVIVSRAFKGSKGKSNLLGMNFLKDNAFHFLFDENRVLILDATQSPIKVELQDLFLGERFHPYVNMVMSDGTQAEGVWDTGAGITVFDIGFIRKHSEIFSKVGTSTGKDSSGTSQETPMYQLKEFVIGGRKFPSVRVAGVDLSVPNSTIKTPMDFILGYNVISKANWIFDFPNKKWAISKMLH